VNGNHVSLQNHQAENDTEGIGIEAIEPDGEPAIPSIIVTIVQLD